MSEHLLINLTGIVGISFLILATVITLRVYLAKKFVEIKNIALGFLLTIPVPLTFILSTIVKGSQYNLTRTVFGIIGLELGGLSAFIVWTNILSLRGEEATGYQKFLVPFYFFSLGFLTLNLRWRWIDNTWVAFYYPSWGVLFVGLPTAWMSFELFKIALKNYQDYHIREIPVQLNLLGFFLVFVSILVLIVERIYFPGSTIFFVGILALGDVFIAISLMMDPYILIPQSIKGKYLVISDKISGGPIVEYHFNTDNQEVSSLFPGAMSGILSILAELTGKEELPEELGYVNLKIVIEEEGNLIAYLIVQQSIQPLRTVLRDILSYIQSSIRKTFEIQHDEIELIRKKIVTDLDFIR